MHTQAPPSVTVGGADLTHPSKSIGRIKAGAELAAFGSESSARYDDPREVDTVRFGRRDIGVVTPQGSSSVERRAVR
jgi:hypothetical protein